jgi:V-type H+-transporting ATPase proteolipid subunit
MSGIIAVYGLVVSVLIAGDCASFPTARLLQLTWLAFSPEMFAVDPRTPYPLSAGFIHLGAGLACGFTGLAAGYAIGHVGDSVRDISSHPVPLYLTLRTQCVRAYVYESRVFVSMVLILIFAEVLGLYG